MAGMTTCDCGAQVSIRFARVFGTTENKVYACLECTPKTDILNGAAARETSHGGKQSWRPGEDEPREARQAGRYDTEEPKPSLVTKGSRERANPESAADEAFEALVTE